MIIALATAALAAPAPASAIDRAEVMRRATSWIRHRVPYSQSRYHKGYRQDCSGFVSMAWNLGRSYTTRSISSRATRIGVSQLRRGDAVLIRGHVSLFGGWKNRRAREYWAFEETTWGSHATKRARRLPRSAVALKRRGLESSPTVHVASVTAASVR